REFRKLPAPLYSGEPAFHAVCVCCFEKTVPWRRPPFETDYTRERFSNYQQILTVSLRFRKSPGFGGSLLPQIGGFQIGQMQFYRQRIFFICVADGKAAAPGRFIESAHMPANG